MVKYGYAGQLLRVDLTTGETSSQPLDEDTCQHYVGGTSLGAKLLYEGVPPGVSWDDPENLFCMASGPLGATRMGGSGTFSVVTKGPMTDGATATQANGFLGAFLRLSGFDGIVLQGASDGWRYLYVHNGTAELRDAEHLRDRDTWETEDAIRAELGYGDKQMSVFSIGPAGENRVRFAALVGDRGHVAGHNGSGAVLGAKRLKAIAVARGRRAVPVYNPQALSQLSKQTLDSLRNDPRSRETYQWGTLAGVTRNVRTGVLPVMNYTTSIFPIDDERLHKFSPEYIRSNFEPTPHPCWACRIHHCHLLRITEGPYKGRVVEEPEYEGFAACGPAIGQTDVASAMVLANEVDRLGMDINETGWVVAWTMECFQRGLLTREDTDGLEMTWGNAENARLLLHRIARRQGFGDLLADGVRRASQRLGGEAARLAIFTQKGNTPRGHDHRANWNELFDTCVSSSGTIETNRQIPLEQFGLARSGDPFSPLEVAGLVARTKGAMQFEDSLGVCRFNTRTNLPLLVPATNAATGWELTQEGAMQVGRRAVNLMRAFNIRHGITGDRDAPSPRYGSAPPDGPAKGITIMPHLNEMLAEYYRLMGWDWEGRPLPETLRALGLDA
ncbi:MAG: hypothetical protein HYY01_14185 [Chloroflexi bacterium]|nr:hypothetical protein [Chloroflexota bacterium]